MQRLHGGSVGKWLIEECGVPEERVLSALAVQWRCNQFSLESFHADEMALAAPPFVLEHTGMLPLRVGRSGVLRLAFTGRPSAAATLAFEHMVGLKAQAGLLSDADWRSAYQALLHCEPVRWSHESLSDEAILSRRIVSDIAGMQPRASRLVRIRNMFWLRMWLEDVSRRGSHGKLTSLRDDMLDRVYTVDPEQAA